MHEKRIWSPGLGRFVRLKLSAAGLRIIDKRGIDAVLTDMKKNGVKF
jgi:large subunit ribosomal protein L28